MRIPPSPPIALHVRSFERFLQADVAPASRRREGLEGALRAVFPVRSGEGGASLEYVHYTLEPPRYDEAECQLRGLTFAAALKVTVRLVVLDAPAGRGEARAVRDIKEQDLYFSEVPCMTPRGTFVVDGVERVLTPALAPAPGARRVRTPEGASVCLYDALGNALELARPARSEAVTLRVSTGPFTAFEALCSGRRPRTLSLRADGVFAPFDDAPRAGRAAPWDVRGADGQVLVAKRQRLTPRRVAALRAAALPGVPLSAREVRLHRLARDVFGPDSALVVAAHQPLRVAALRRLAAAGVTVVDTYLPDAVTTSPEALLADARAAKRWLHQHLPGFDLGLRGRAAADATLGVSSPPGVTTWTDRDLDAAFAWLSTPDPGAASDAPSYAVRAAGEALTGAALRGLRAMAREARVHLDHGEVDTLMPCDVLSARGMYRALRAPLLAAATSAPWQRRNPLAAVGHLRRVALGRGVAWPGAVEGAVSLPLEVEVGPDGEVAPPPRAQASLWDGPFARALPLLAPEALPDADARAVLRATGAVRESAHDGRAVVVDAGVVLVVPDDPGAEVEVHALTGFVAGDAATCRAERATITDGARVRRGDLLAEGDGVVAGALALGCSVRVGFSEAVPAGEARVSEAVLRAGRFTARACPTRTAVLRDTRHGREERTATPPDATEHTARHLDASGIVALGAVVEPGDILVGVRRPGVDDLWEGVSLRAPELGPATVRHVQIFERRGNARCPRHEALLEAEQALWSRVEARARALMAPEAADTLAALSACCRGRIDRAHHGDALPPGVLATVQVTLELAQPLKPGDRLADRHGCVVTVGAVVAESAMPVDAMGLRAEVLLSAAETLPAATRAEASRGALYLVKIT